MFFDVPMMLAANFLYQAICHSQYFTKCSGWIANPPVYFAEFGVPAWQIVNY